MTAEARDHALPVDLRDRVLAAALRARGAGRATPAAPEISPAEAFRRAADAFHGTLRLLRDDQWHEPALRGQKVTVASLHADTGDALAVTNSVKLARRQGPLLLHLVQKDGRWLIHDVDQASDTTVTEKVKRFRKDHPQAKLEK